VSTHYQRLQHEQVFKETKREKAKIHDQSINQTRQFFKDSLPNLSISIKNSTINAVSVKEDPAFLEIQLRTDSTVKIYDYSDVNQLIIKFKRYTADRSKAVIVPPKQKASHTYLLVRERTYSVIEWNSKNFDRISATEKSAEEFLPLMEKLDRARNGLLRTAERRRNHA